MGRTSFPFAGKSSSDDHHDVSMVANQLCRRDGTRYHPPRQVSLENALVAVVAADIGPLQPVGRPHSAPAAVVGGVGVGRAKEGKAMEAVMEESTVSEREPSSMRKVRARKMAAGKMRAAAHGGEMHPATHAAAMHSATHAAAMHSASHAAAMATTAAASARECRWRQSKRRTERTRDQATQELVVHPNPPWLNSFDGRRRKKTTSKPKGSNDFK